LYFAYRDKKVVSVFVRFHAPIDQMKVICVPVSDPIWNSLETYQISTLT
jgi:hypothetical protein